MAMNKKTAVSEQKKRAFDALERRFAAAKAELEHQQKFKKQAHEEKGQILSRNSSSISSPKLKFSSPGPSSEKGQCASSDNMFFQRASQDDKASGPTYFPLSQPVHDNLLQNSSKLSSRRGSIGDKIVHDLLLSGDSAQKYMQGSRSMKVDNWLLLDSLVQSQGASKGAFMRATVNSSECSKSRVSMQQHRKLGSLNFPQEFHDFDLFKPMHEMWKGYILQLIKNNGKSQLSQCLLSADLHGAILQVVPKKGSVFIFQAGCWKVTLQGDKLSARNVGT